MLRFKVNLNKQTFAAKRLHLTGDTVYCFGCYIRKTVVVEVPKSSESVKLVKSI